MDQEGLEGLDSFTLARLAWIEAKRRAVMPPMTPPPAPTPGGLGSRPERRLAGRWDLRSAVDVLVWYVNSPVDL